jgi:hypothetical protein
LRNAYDKIHGNQDLPKRVVSVDVSPLTAPDAHTWLHIHEKEIARMRDLFGRKTNQPALPQIVSYADARFCQITAIPQLQIHACPQGERRSGILVARQLSKARRLKDKGDKSKEGEDETSGAKMCKHISNLLLSVGIDEENDHSVNSSKQKMQRAKSRTMMKAKALAAFTAEAPRSAGANADHETPLEQNPFGLASANDSPRLAAVHEDNEADHASVEEGSSNVKDNDSVTSSADGDALVNTDKEKGAAAASSSTEPEHKNKGIIHGVAHMLHLTDSTNGKNVPKLDLPANTGDDDRGDLVSPSALLAAGNSDSDEETETAYAELTYSSDESADSLGLKGVDSDEEEPSGSQGNKKRLTAAMRDALGLKERHKARAAKRHSHVRRKLSKKFKPRSLAIGNESTDDDEEEEEEEEDGEVDEPGTVVPHLNVFTMKPEDVQWDDELSLLYHEAGMLDKIKDVPEILQSNKGAELEFIERLIEKYADVLPLEQKIRTSNLKLILERPPPSSLDLKAELEQLYELCGKPELKEGAESVVKEYAGREVELIEQHVAKYLLLLPEGSQMTERMECIRVMFTPSGLLPNPLNKNALKKFTFGRRKSRVHDINHALYVHKDDIDWKGELTHMYLLIGKPEKVSELDKIIEANKGVEVLLIKRFRENYESKLPKNEQLRLSSLEFIMKKPHVTWTPGMIDWEAELATIYLAAGQMEKLEVVRDIAEANKGAEAELVLRLVDKYRTFLPPQLVTRLVALREIAAKPSLYSTTKDINWKAELAAFYLAIDKPEKLEHLDAILEDNKGSEGDLFAHFCDKYRTEIPNVLIEHILSLGRLIERERLGQSYLDNFDNLQLSGYQYDTNQTRDKHEVVHIIDLSLNRIRFLDFSHKMTWSVNHVVALNLAGNLLVTLEGIGSCEQLRFLNCSDNLLTDMYALRSCSRLRHLKISGNRLTSLSFLSPREMEVADDPDEHSKALLDSRRGTKGAYKSVRATKFFMSQFGRGEDQETARRASVSVISPRASPRLLAAMLHAAKQRQNETDTTSEGDGSSSSAAVSGAARSDSTNFDFYNTAEGIDWEKEIVVFYTSGGLLDKLSSVPNTLKTYVGSEGKAQMCQDLYEKYRPEPSQNFGHLNLPRYADDEDKDQEGDNNINKMVALPTSLIPRSNLLRLQQLQALATPRAVYAQPYDIDWRVELSLFYQAMGMHDKAAIVSKILSGHKGYEDELTDQILAKYDADAAAATAPLTAAERGESKDGATTTAPTVVVRIPEAARERLMAARNQLAALHTRDYEGGVDGEGEEKAGGSADGATSNTKAVPHASWLGGKQSKLSVAVNSDKGNSVDSPEPTPRVMLPKRLADEKAEGGPMNNSNSQSTLGTAFSSSGDSSDADEVGAPKQTRFAPLNTAVDEGMGAAVANKQVFKLPHLEYLNASENSTLESLHGLRHYSHVSLQHLELRHCNLRDQHLVELVDLPLNTLLLDNNHIASLDDSLPYLTTLRHLKNLSLLGNPVQVGSSGSTRTDDDDTGNGADMRSQDTEKNAKTFMASLVQESTVSAAVKAGKSSGGYAKNGSSVDQVSTMSRADSQNSQNSATIADKALVDSEAEKAANQHGKAASKSLYSIAILDNIDTLETLDHLTVPPALYTQLRRLKAQVEGDAILADIERYYSSEMMSMEDVHKNLASKHRRSETLIKAIVKDKTVRIEEEMSALMKYARTRLLTLRSGAGSSNGLVILGQDEGKNGKPSEVLSTVRSEFNSKRRQREDNKAAAQAQREALERLERENKQRAQQAVVASPNKTSPRRDSVLGGLALSPKAGL